MWLIKTIKLRSTIFSRVTAFAGLLAGVLMIVPPTAGTIGPIFALASLAPWAIFVVLVAGRLLQMAYVAGVIAWLSVLPGTVLLDYFSA